MKIKNITLKISQKIRKIVSGTIGYIFSKPKSIKDYVKLNELYISKRFILRILLIGALVVFGMVEVVIPYMEGRFWTATVVVNSDKFHEFNGKAKVVNEDKTLLYQGTMSEGRITGKGELYEGEKLIYKGDLVDEKYEGEGSLYREDVLLYKGNFQENVYEGEGKLYHPNGKIKYEGQFTAGQFSEGTEYYPDGKVKYYGKLEGGEYTGAGKLYADDGENTLLYEGNFVRGQYNGEGKLYNGAKLLYTGNFKDNVYDGAGKLYFENGKLRYEGDFALGKYSGEGTLYSSKSYKLLYKGLFNDGVYDVNCMIYDEETGRLIYEGDFLEGVYNGFGKLYSNMGRVIYTGNFYLGNIDYESFCDAQAEMVREAFGTENQLIMLENSFGLYYKDFDLMFELEYSYDETPPYVNKIRFFGDTLVNGVMNGQDIKLIKKRLNEELFTEYNFIVTEEDAEMFGLAGSDIGVGEEVYSIKALFEKSYVRAYSKSADGEIIYYEIGGI